MKKVLGLVAILSLAAVGCEPATPTPSNTAPITPAPVVVPADPTLPSSTPAPGETPVVPSDTISTPPADPAK